MEALGAFVLAFPLGALVLGALGAFVLGALGALVLAFPLGALELLGVLQLPPEANSLLSLESGVLAFLAICRDR